MNNMISGRRRLSIKSIDWKKHITSLYGIGFIIIMIGFYMAATGNEDMLGKISIISSMKNSTFVSVIGCVCIAYEYYSSIRRSKVESEIHSLEHPTPNICPICGAGLYCSACGRRFSPEGKEEFRI